MHGVGAKERGEGKGVNELIGGAMRECVGQLLRKLTAGIQLRRPRHQRGSDVQETVVGWRDDETRHEGRSPILFGTVTSRAVAISGLA